MIQDARSTSFQSEVGVADLWETLALVESGMYHVGYIWHIVSLGEGRGGSAGH